MQPTPPIEGGGPRPCPRLGGSRALLGVPPGPSCPQLFVPCGSPCWPSGHRDRGALWWPWGPPWKSWGGHLGPGALLAAPEELRRRGFLA
eukprot:2941723-Pyramimonas_sp.AAC.1